MDEEELNAEDIVDPNFPLHAIIKQNFEFPEERIEKLDHILRDNEININIQDGNGDTPLHCASAKGYVDVVEKLLSYKDSIVIDILDSKGQTPLHCAVEKQQLETVKILLLFGANPNSKRLQDGYTPSHIAAQNGYTDILKFLLENGGSNIPNNSNNTPLHLACSNNKMNEIGLLLDSGLENIASYNDQNQSALQLFVTSKYLEYPEFHHQTGPLAKDYVKIILKAATRKNHVDVVLYLLKFNSMLSTKFLTMADLGFSMYNAASEGFVELTETFLDFGCDVDYKIRTNTALCLAAQTENIDMAIVLLGRGAEVNLQGRHLKTPLHHACRNHHTEFVDMLLAAGANPNVRDLSYETCLHEGALFLSVSQSLLEYDADIYAQNTIGETAYIIAEDLQRSEVLYLFRWHIIMKEVLDLYLGIPIKEGQGPEVYKNCEDVAEIFSTRRKCFEDVAKIEETLCDDLTFKDILTENLSKVSHYVNRDEVKSQIFDDGLIAKFPVYAKMIRCRFRKLSALSALLKPIGNSLINLHDLLTQNHMNLVKLLRNEEVIEYMDSCNLRKLTPRYALEISENYKCAKAKRVIFDKILQGMENTSNSIRSKLSNDYIEYMLFFLDDDSLKALQKALWFNAVPSRLMGSCETQPIVERRTLQIVEREVVGDTAAGPSHVFSENAENVSNQTEKHPQSCEISNSDSVMAGPSRNSEEAANESLPPRPNEEVKQKSKLPRKKKKKKKPLSESSNTGECSSQKSTDETSSKPKPDTDTSPKNP